MTCYLKEVRRQLVDGRRTHTYPTLLLRAHPWTQLQLCRQMLPTRTGTRVPQNSLDRRPRCRLVPRVLRGRNGYRLAAASHGFDGVALVLGATVECEPVWRSDRIRERAGFRNQLLRNLVFTVLTRRPHLNPEDTGRAE